ncbi:hypothetical protein HHL11_01545 [Ramlibacter sp. G-1-2-2]|uniref:Nitrate reductase n=1 Tax=Ramlibacter agri TaxID=2728837 RepID=A0A848H0Z6_9BURK|nr:hypothetical protein [Ramlibacter agri]NML42413.1 hypothetical protein [Ramlibacter agri]
MSSSPHEPHNEFEPQDAVEAVVPVIPIVLPLVGGVLMFLLAFIAIYMA